MVPHREINLGNWTVLTQGAAGAIQQYIDAANLRGKDGSFEALLERWHIDWTMLNKDAPANKLLTRLPGWRQAYTDDQATIFVRDR